MTIRTPLHLDFRTLLIEKTRTKENLSTRSFALHKKSTKRRSSLTP